MKLFFKYFLFIFFLVAFFSKNQLYAGLGIETWGGGGIKRDIEVNEIEDVNTEDKEVDSEENKNIKSMELKKIDPNTIGILHDTEGGLGYKMWEGSKRDFVEKYLKLLPINIKSEIIIELTKRLLLSSADLPLGKGKEDLILIRINKLVELGDLENASLLIDSLKFDNKNQDLLKKETEINLSLNNFDLVCSDIDERTKEYQDDLYWKKIQIFCQILNEEINKANLSLSLIKEETKFNDNDFLNLIESLIYKEEIESSQFSNLNLLNLAMTRIGKIKLNEGLYFKNNPLFYTMLYKMPNVPIETRIETLEKSQKLINLSAEVVEEIYNSYQVTDEEMNFSIDDQTVYLGKLTQAILYQRAIREKNEEVKAKIIKKAINLALSNGNYPLIVKLNIETILEIKPSKKLLWFASTACKALFYTNKLEEAYAWYEILEKMKFEDQNSFKDFIDLWPVTEIYKIKDNNYKNIDKLNVSQDEILDFINKLQKENKKIEFNTLGLYFLENYGIEINPRIWLSVIDNDKDNIKYFPDATMLSLLDNATKNNRVAETILLILIAIDERNLNDFSPFFLQKIIKSLDRIGLGTKAKDFMIETLVF